jgi:hypothetical protein
MAVDVAVQVVYSKYSHKHGERNGESPREMCRLATVHDIQEDRWKNRSMVRRPAELCYTELREGLPRYQSKTLPLNNYRLSKSRA